MKILTFLSRQIQGHKAKSFGFILVVILIILLGYGMIWLYQNISSAVKYYSHIQVVNPHRMSIVAESNIFSLLSKGGGSLEQKDINSLYNDSRLENIQTFTLVPYPVTGDFSVFSFNLESDIPVFALSGNTLDTNGVGISKKMLEYYNLQFAGSSPLFPKIDEEFIIGKSVTVTVGKSKIFDLGNQESATEIKTKITNIHPDYPGFGIVLHRDVLEEKMKEIGFSLENPYKIIAYAKNLDDISSLRETYKHLKISFDQDTIQETSQRLQTLQLVFLMSFCAIISIVGTIILFLLGSILREIQNIYRMIHQLGIYGIKSHIFTLGEPIILSVIGGTIGGALAWIVFSYSSNIAVKILPEKGILFPFVFPIIGEIILFTIGSITIIVAILICYNWRQLTLIGRKK